MKLWLLAVLFIIPGISFAEANTATLRKTVLVGAYGFAPYYDLEKGRGIVTEVLEQLNSMQADFHFKVVEIPSSRRYQSFTDGKVDMIFFEDPRWEWKDIPHYTIPVGIQDAEVYIALKKKAKDQSYFNSLTGKRIAGIVGYHYGFAKFNADEAYLQSKFKISLVSHNLASVRLVLHERADVAVVPLSFIRRYLRENPEKNAEVLISEKVDQHYDLRLIVNPKASIPRERLENLMSKLVKEPSYQALF
ncbi:amino acid ABC transporter substrate-binding protein [Bdellovibrio sp. ZAP7]|uniref:substrate-binding periplasmic protein n=1 Tax=Bdellovibrio sp. ZAP7 TaxID=2231053 RepID=UPI001158F9DA|nr:transporter substrate-binding domain-containing protein [Bdellovibrio sp. ZAP7]QDK44068.1 amino acid ABC transporter substrate-binding protein [Bdellovibrio sp. ZAP7]